MSLGGFFEGLLMGDKKFGPDLKRMAKMGEEEFRRGQGTTAEGLRGFRDLNKRYTSRLDSGQVLDPAVLQGFERARGGVRDTAARRTRNVRSGLSQRVAESGGMISDAARAELERQGIDTVGEQEFDALNNVNLTETSFRQQAVTDLMNRIDAARAAILQTGQFQQGIGLAMQQGGNQLRYQRNKAISDATFQATSAATTGFSGGVT